MEFAQQTQLQERRKAQLCLLYTNSAFIFERKKLRMCFNYPEHNIFPSLYAKIFRYSNQKGKFLKHSFDYREIRPIYLQLKSIQVLMEMNDVKTKRRTHD